MPPTMKREPDWKQRLEFIGENLANKSGRSGKFWQAEVYGCRFVRRWGKIGTTGQTMSEEFGSPFEAKEAAVKMAESKRQKGYTTEVDIIQLIGSLDKDDVP